MYTKRNNSDLSYSLYEIKKIYLT